MMRKGQAYAKVVSISAHRLDDMYVFTYGGLSYVNVVNAYSKTAVKPQGFL